MKTRLVLKWMFWLYAAWCMIQAWLPSTGGDPCRLIMFAPKWYLRQGGIEFHPWFDPFQFHEMLLLLQMHIVRDPGATLPVVMMTLSALVLWDMAERYWPFGHNAGPLAALLYVTMPISRLCSFYNLTEHTMVFFFLLGLNGVLRYATTGKDRWLVLGGLCAGCACAVDVNALIPVLILVAFAGRGCWRMLGWIMLAMLPWYGFNVLWYGNPIFPFYERWFGWMRWGMHEDLSSAYSQAGAGLRQVSALSVFSSAPHAQSFSPLVWLFAPLFFWLKLEKRFKRNLAWCLIVLFVILLGSYWLFYEWLVHARYWMPLLAVLSLAGGVGLGRVRWGATAATLVLATYMVFVTIPTVPIGFALTKQERLGYLLQMRPGCLSVMTLNNMELDGRVYLLDLEDYRVYCKFDLGGRRHGEESYRNLCVAEDPYEWLVERGYDYLLVNAIYVLPEHVTGVDMTGVPLLELPEQHFVLMDPVTVVRIYKLVEDEE